MYAFIHPSPGMSTLVSRRRSSWNRHCQTLHSSLGRRITSPTDAWQRTRNHPRRPVEIMNSRYQPSVNHTRNATLSHALILYCPYLSS